jgi:ABC-type transport system involved in multi-copper enzyme maturation permease subunit
MLGPVFHAELLTTARRARYYAVRAVYVMAVLCVLWSSYESSFGTRAISGSGDYPVSLMTEFAARLFQSFGITQAVTVLALTPALVAGTIATEKQRKTLHYLLASELSSRDIVFGKLAARLLHVVVFLALGLPIFSLLMMFGGIDYWQILVMYGMTALGVLFLASISILASVQARKGRDAIILAYSLILAWVLVPFALLALISLLWPAAVDGIWTFMIVTYPGAGLTLSTGPPPPSTFLADLPAWAIEYWSIAIVILYSAGLIVLAAARIRPLAARQENKPRVTIGLDNRGRRQYRVLPRPPCSERDPMLWKERYTSRLGGLARLLTNLVGLVVVTLIACIAFEVIKDSLREMWSSGFFPSDTSRNRTEMSAFVRGVIAALFCLWIVCTAASAAASISGEREEDTWLSLTSTSLTGREILRAKRWGAIVRYRLLGYTMGVLALLAVATGAVHPLGVLATAVVCGVVLWFTAALGTYVSLRSQTTLRALSLTILPLIFLNGGYFLCCVPLPDNAMKDMADAAIPARQAWASFCSYHDVAILFPPRGSTAVPASLAYSGGGEFWHSENWARQLRWFFGFYVLIVPLYALAGMLLCRRARLWYPRAAGRPVRPGHPPEADDDQAVGGTPATFLDLEPNVGNLSH